MMLRNLPALPLLALAACSAEPVRLYQLREAPQDSPQFQSYQRLEKAVALANEFLRTSPDAYLFPAEGARFRLSFSDLLVEYRNEGIAAVRMETPGWGDPRTLLGDGYHPTEHGFMAERMTGETTPGDDTNDSGFLALAHDEMAAVLLRQVAMQREIEERGAFDYWVNYDLLGLWPGNGYGAGNPVNRRAYAVEAAFRSWLAARGGNEPAPEELSMPDEVVPEFRRPEDYQEPT